MTDFPSTTITLPTELLIRNLNEIQGVLAEAEVTPQLTFDASAVTKADTAGLQLLASYINHCQNQGSEIIWSNCNEALHNAGKLLNLSELLHLPETTD
ncbi:MAG: STAS domain-containing protein [Motiliproteus sp.]|nr:STAS domain-containing protein [Motiliproteus sp.]MCW9053058.1 STAS domain-containing protein [Motiliproteus sp.]